MNFCRPAFSIRLACIDLDVHPPSWIAVLDCSPAPAGSQGAPTLFPHCECGSGKNPKEAQARVRQCTVLCVKSVKIHRNSASCWAEAVSSNDLYQYACHYVWKFLFCLAVCSRHHTASRWIHTDTLIFLPCRWRNSVAFPRMVRTNLWTHWLITGAHLSLWRAG